MIYWSFWTLPLTGLIDLQNQHYGFMGNYSFSLKFTCAELSLYLHLQASHQGHFFGRIWTKGFLWEAPQWNALLCSVSSLFLQQTDPRVPRVELWNGNQHSMLQSKGRGLLPTEAGTVQFPAWADKDCELQLERLLLNAFCVHLNHFRATIVAQN